MMNQLSIYIFKNLKTDIFVCVYIYRYMYVCVYIFRYRYMAHISH